MKKYFIISLLILTASTGFGQDSTSSKQKHNLYISALVGRYYKNFFGSKYIVPKKISPIITPQSQYSGFTKVPTGGFETGFLVNIPLNKNKKWFIQTGLLYAFRKSIFKNNLDSMISNQFYHYGVLGNRVLKYNYTYHDIELPVMFNYNINRFTASLGFRLVLISFYKAKYTYLDYDYNLPTPKYSTSTKMIKGAAAPILLLHYYSLTNGENSLYIHYALPIAFLSFQINYQWHINNFKVNPFLGFDYGARKSFYLKAGIEIPIIKSKQKKN